MPWADVEFHVEEIPNPAVTDLLAAFADVYANGGAILRSLRAINPKEFTRAVQADLRNNDSLLQTVLTAPTVIAGLPELNIEIGANPLPTFARMSGFEMEGALTHLLLSGGAYNRFSGSIDQARTLTRTFMESLFGPDLTAIAASYTYAPWTPWFYDIAWDSTFIVSDFQRHRFVLLCCTDTD